jgi:hypothetical protein
MHQRALFSVLLLVSALGGCNDPARTAFQECTIGISQAVALARDEQERRRQEIMYASACMFERGYVLDAEHQREDAIRHRLSSADRYWVRR